MAYRNHPLGMDDWEWGNDRGMDGIDDPDVPSTRTEKAKRINLEIVKADGSKIYGQQAIEQNEVDYLVTPRGTALFIGAEVEKAGLDSEIAQRPHTELPAEYLPLALRMGKNPCGTVIEDSEAAYQKRQAKRDAERAKLPLEQQILNACRDLDYEAEITGEFPAGTEHPTPAFWELWKKRKAEIKELGYQVWKCDDYDFWVVVPPQNK